jgi:hypothetical protein
MALEEKNRKRHSRAWIYILTVVLLLILIPAVLIYQRARQIDDWTRDWVVQELTERFQSRVELESVHVTAFPEMSATGENLTIYYRNRTDVPPMLRIQQFTFHLGVMGILRVPRHIRGVHIDNMVITIPPRGQPPAGSPVETPLHARTRKSLPKIMIDQIVCDETTLLILPKKAGKDPLDFDIHDLILKSVVAGKPLSFRGNLTNAKPVGEIRTQGNFGPWQLDDPGSTAINGAYTFTDADLGPFPGIGGTLSSSGNYSGVLGSIEVQGVTDTPKFSLDPIGHPVPLHTEFSATVDGTNGDTYLHPVRATLGRSQITASGSVVRVPEKQGHLISLDVVAPKARLEDLLQLSTKSTQPMMSGLVNLKTKMILPPGKVKVLDKLTLDGEFTVSDARFASSDVREKLEAFSRHAQGQPDNPNAGSAISDLRGQFHLKNGVITFQRLTFSIQGATIVLDGSYKLRGEGLDFTGQLRMDAKLSQLVSGKKSILLKAIDPFFNKNGAGTLIPITISGSRDNPTLEFSMFHRKMRKSFSKDKKNEADQQNGDKKIAPVETKSSPG